MIKALIFDFDGLILDTETPEFEVWRDVYREFGQDLSIETWGQIVGGMAATDFRPLPNLQTLTGRDLTPLNLSARAVEQSRARIVALPLLPGVHDTLHAAQRLGLRLAVALFVHGGLATLEAIRRQNYDVWTRRPTVSRVDKLRLLFGCWWNAIQRV